MMELFRILLVAILAFIGGVTVILWLLESASNLVLRIPPVRSALTLFATAIAKFLPQKEHNPTVESEPQIPPVNEPVKSGDGCAYRAYCRIYRFFDTIRRIICDEWGEEKEIQRPENLTQKITKEVELW